MIETRPEVIIQDEPDARKHFDIHERLHVGTEVGSLAISLITTMCAAYVPDGETSSGEQRWRRMTEDEVVQRAFSIADKCIAEAVRRGWAVQMPSYEETLKNTSSVGFSS